METRGTGRGRDESGLEGSAGAVSRRAALAVGMAGLAWGLVGCAGPGLGASPLVSGADAPEPERPLFEISLAEWSLHRALRAGEMSNLDFPRVAREEFGISAVEYVNSFFKDSARDRGYLADLRGRCADQGVRSLLIMCDGEGALGDPDEEGRSRAIRNHHRWVEAAVDLGCHSIRVNAQSAGERGEQARLAADGLARLGEFAGGHGINVIVENHGGLSSDGSWLAGVMRRVGRANVGTLPDFGNFCLDWSRSEDPAAWYDRYKGVAEMMPFARAVSAKSHEFNAAGDEAGTDYRRMLRIVMDAGYRGFVGIEYEGERRSEREGIRLTKALLERVRAEMEGEYRGRA